MNTKCQAHVIHTQSVLVDGSCTTVSIWLKTQRKTVVLGRLCDGWMTPLSYIHIYIFQCCQYQSVFLILSIIRFATHSIWMRMRCVHHATTFPLHRHGDATTYLLKTIWITSNVKLWMFVAWEWLFIAETGAVECYFIQCIAVVHKPLLSASPTNFSSSSPLSLFYLRNVLLFLRNTNQIRFRSMNFIKLIFSISFYLNNFHLSDLVFFRTTCN